MRNKKGTGGQTAILVIICLVVVGVGGMYAYDRFFAKEEAPAATGGSTSGELGSLKYSVETITDATPSQFAGTGYCWDASAPKSLIESRNGKTLSTTAGTTFSPAYRGSTYECTSFDSSHFCDHQKAVMTKEGLELRSSCKNISANSNVQLTLYENDVAETSNVLTAGAGQTVSYNKFMVQVNTSHMAYPLKAICFGSNNSATHIKDLKINGWKKDTVPTSLTSTADYCYSLPTAEILNSWDQKIFSNSIVIEGDDTGMDNDLINVTIADECEYVAEDGSVKKDFFKRDTSSEADCGQTNQALAFTIL